MRSVINSERNRVIKIISGNFGTVYTPIQILGFYLRSLLIIFLFCLFVFLCFRISPFSDFQAFFAKFLSLQPVPFAFIAYFKLPSIFPASDMFAVFPCFRLVCMFSLFQTCLHVFPVSDLFSDLFAAFPCFRLVFRLILFADFPCFILVCIFSLFRTCLHFVSLFQACMFSLNGLVNFHFLELSIINFGEFDEDGQSKQYGGWSHCTDMLAGLSQQFYHRLITMVVAEIISTSDDKKEQCNYNLQNMSVVKQIIL